MPGMRIVGLVREAKRAQEALALGVPVAARAAFLAGVRRTVVTVEGLLAEDGMPERDLPSPSRSALLALRRIAALSPDAIPEPVPGGAPGGPVVRPGVKNVVGTLDRCLRALSGGSDDPKTLEMVRMQAELCAHGVDLVCRDQGADPSALPDRSRRAYAMSKWLSVRENVALYAAQVRTFARVAPAARRAAGLPDAPRILARFEPGRILYRWRRRADADEWQLGVGFLAAGEGDLADLALRACLKPSAPQDVEARLAAFVQSEDFAAVATELDLLADARPRRARGRAHDLDALFDRLDARFFHGSLARPRLHWAPTLSRRQFGCFVRSLDLVCLNPVLDDPSVPEFVVEWVLYHELLHKRHPTELSGGRRVVHGPAFKAEERLHPRSEEGHLWLHHICLAAAGASDPAPVEEPERGADDDDDDDDADADDVGDDAPEVPPASPSREAPGREAARTPPPRPGRNDPCWCGSGRKYKRCHLAEDASAAGGASRPG